MEGGLSPGASGLLLAEAGETSEMTKPKMQGSLKPLLDRSSDQEKRKTLTSVETYHVPCTGPGALHKAPNQDSQQPCEVDFIVTVFLIGQG